MQRSVGLWKSTTKTNLKHNNREQNEYENNLIDKSREKENKYLVQKDIREIYSNEFGEALEKYNAKQKRKDRKIKDYYTHLKKGKKTKTQQEMILQVGEGKDYQFGDDGWKAANEILMEYANDFEKRNPNLKVYNAVIHNDETTPHLHINFVPVATGYQRGLDKQVAFDKAIKQQSKELDVERPFDAWREQEVEYIAELMRERGIERKLVGTNDIEDTNELKRITAEREKLEKERNLLEKEKKAFAESQIKNIGSSAAVELSYSHKEKIIEEYETTEKNFLGMEKVVLEQREVVTRNYVMTPKDVDKNERVLKDYEGLKGDYGRLRRVLIAEVNLRKQQEQEYKNELAAINKEINQRAERLRDESFDKLKTGAIQVRNFSIELSKELKEVKNENAKLKNRLVQEEKEYEGLTDRFADFLEEHEKVKADRDDWKNKFEVLWENTKHYLKKYLPNEMQTMVVSVKSWFREDTGQNIEPEPKKKKQRERDDGMSL